MSTPSTRAGIGASVIVTPREMWLAGLGAAVVTREWASKEAGPLFRSLVKEGTIVETRAVRMVGEGIEASFERANTLWRSARTTVTSRVRSYADSAVALAREIPRSLPHIELPGMRPAPAPVAQRARRAAKTVKTRTAARGKKARRAVKRAAKRA